MQFHTFTISALALLTLAGCANPDSGAPPNGILSTTQFAYMVCQEQAAGYAMEGCAVRVFNLTGGDSGEYVPPANLTGITVSSFIPLTAPATTLVIDVTWKNGTQHQFRRDLSSGGQIHPDQARRTLTTVFATCDVETLGLAVEELAGKSSYHVVEAHIAPDLAVARELGSASCNQYLG